MNKAILDTDIFSEIIKGVNQTVTAHAKAYRRAFGHYTASAVTVMEIVQGYQQKQAMRQLQAFLTALPSQEVLSFDGADGELAGRIAGELERTGRPIGTADSMIAAIAIGHGLELVTGNRAGWGCLPARGEPQGRRGVGRGLSQEFDGSMVSGRRPIVSEILVIFKISIPCKLYRRSDNLSLVLFRRYGLR